jgi:hypothetical protein
MITRVNICTLLQRPRGVKIINQTIREIDMLQLANQLNVPLSDRLQMISKQEKTILEAEQSTMERPTIMEVTLLVLTLKMRKNHSKMNPE